MSIDAMAFPVVLKLSRPWFKSRTDTFITLPLHYSSMSTADQGDRFLSDLIAQEYIRYGYDWLLLRILRREVGVPG